MEVLVTIVITSIGLLGLNSLQLQANRAATDTGNRSQAVWLLSDLSNRMYANQMGLTGYNTNGAAVSCTAPTKICTAHHNGSARIAANTTCTPAEQAASDLWEVGCGFGLPNGSSILFNSAVDFMSNPELSVSMDANNRATLTMSWDVRTSGVSADGKKVYTVSKNVNSSAILRDSISMEFLP